MRGFLKSECKLAFGACILESHCSFVFINSTSLQLRKVEFKTMEYSPFWDLGTNYVRKKQFQQFPKIHFLYSRGIEDFDAFQLALNPLFRQK